MLAARVRVGSIPGAPLDGDRALAAALRRRRRLGARLRLPGHRPAQQRGRSHRRPLAGRALGRGAHPHAAGSAARSAWCRSSMPARSASDPRPSFDEIKVGAGIGVRYYTSFGPLRLDVGSAAQPGAGRSRRRRLRRAGARVLMADDEPVDERSRSAGGAASPAARSPSASCAGWASALVAAARAAARSRWPGSTPARAGSGWSTRSPTLRRPRACRSRSGGSRARCCGARRCTT